MCFTVLLFFTLADVFEALLLITILCVSGFAADYAGMSSTTISDNDDDDDDVKRMREQIYRRIRALYNVLLCSHKFIWHRVIPNNRTTERYSPIV